MRSAFLGAVLSALFITPVYADVVPVLEDPATFHVGADSSGGPGSDPNFIPSNSEFFILQEAGQDVPPPIELIFAVPDYGSPLTAPFIQQITLNGTTTATFTPVADTGKLFASGDLYTFLSLVGNNSLNIGNLDSGLTAHGIPVPTGFEIFTATVMTPGLNGKDYYDVIGTFGAGTYIAPWGNDGHKAYTTQFTNVGLIGRDPPAVPELSTWAMMGLGFGLLGLVGLKRRRDAIAAF